MPLSAKQPLPPWEAMSEVMIEQMQDDVAALVRTAMEEVSTNCIEVIVKWIRSMRELMLSELAQSAPDVGRPHCREPAEGAHLDVRGVRQALGAGPAEPALEDLRRDPEPSASASGRPPGLRASDSAEHGTDTSSGTESSADAGEQAHEDEEPAAAVPAHTEQAAVPCGAREDEAGSDRERDVAAPERSAVLLAPASAVHDGHPWQEREAAAPERGAGDLAAHDSDGRVWQVVGGARHGGVLVRHESDLASPSFDERLSVGALLLQLALVGGRLRYFCITGTGPETGWVSIAVPGRVLVKRVAMTPREAFRLAQEASRLDTRAVQAGEAVTTAPGTRGEIRLSCVGYHHIGPREDWWDDWLLFNDQHRFHRVTGGDGGRWALQEGRLHLVWDEWPHEVLLTPDCGKTFIGVGGGDGFVLTSLGDPLWFARASSPAR